MNLPIGIYLEKYYNCFPYTNFITAQSVQFSNEFSPNSTQIENEIRQKKLALLSSITVVVFILKVDRTKSAKKWWHSQRENLRTTKKLSCKDERL